ncbi:MAG: VOC family protein [Ignavibacteria bacterium]|nr:VOC family protein [Ignavibacteria bacterium]
MAEQKPEIGSIGWIDLTVTNAQEIRDFYSKIAGWNYESLSMGEYEDYVMLQPSSKTPAAGICHKRGANAGLPSQWLIYITVANIEESVKSCEPLGGKLIAPIRNYAEMGKYCVIEDPAGSVCALFEAK